LHLGDTVQGERGLAARFRSVNLGNSAPWQTADPEAMSRLSEPVGTAGIFSVSRDPKRMIDPLPYCRWI